MSLFWDVSIVSASLSPILVLNKRNILMAQSKQKPVHEVRLGRIRAAIWQNETQNGTRHSVTFSRLYKDDDGWKDSSSFGRDDLPLLEKVADLAHTWIFTSAQTADETKPDEKF